MPFRVTVTGWNPGVVMDLEKLAIRRESHNGLRKAQGIIVRKRIAKGALDRMKEILAVEESMDAAG